MKNNEKLLNIDIPTLVAISIIYPAWLQAQTLYGLFIL